MDDMRVILALVKEGICIVISPCYINTELVVDEALLMAIQQKKQLKLLTSLSIRYAHAIWRSKG